MSSGIMSPNAAILAELTLRANSICATTNTEKKEVTLILPVNVLPKTIAIHGYDVTHGEEGPAIFISLKKED